MDDYCQEGIKLLKKVYQENKNSLSQASQLFAEAQMNKHKIFVFGAGHSHMISEELFYRAGGITNIQPIFIERLMLHQSASRASLLEKKNNEIELDLAKYQIKKNDLMVVISSSGKNPPAIDIARWALAHHAKVIVITSKAISQQTNSLHHSKLFLKDYGDVVIDNLIAYGDFALTKNNYHFGSFSTFIGIALIQSILTESIKIIINQKLDPQIFQSGNIKANQTQNNNYLKTLRNKIRFI